MDTYRGRCHISGIYLSLIYRSTIYNFPYRNRTEEKKGQVFHLMFENQHTTAGSSLCYTLCEGDRTYGDR